VSPASAAVVLVNLGTPQAPTPAAVRRYLREFLSDRRVVDLHPALWRPILECCILPIRPRRSAAKYATVWTDEGSPLAVHTAAQVEALADALGPDVEVLAAMRYGSPSVADVLAGAVARGHERVLVVPMYPQYAGSAAGSVLERTHEVIAALPHHPLVRMVRAFGEHPAYVEAVCTALEDRWASVGRPDGAAGDRVLLSFHGIPQAHADAGDPYPRECAATTEAVRARLGLDDETLLMTFQSKFGPAPWLTPPTIDTVAALGAAGCRRLEVVCPGFVSDCLETLEEIEQLNREAYDEAGGAGFAYVPWGNVTPAWTAALAQIVTEHLAGWSTAPAAR
jgi:ferrochelatase